MTRFSNRSDAGKRLAEELSKHKEFSDAVVLALARGGVPVGLEVAEALQVPLDVFVVRKLGVPGHEELAMGAIASGDVVGWNEDILRGLNLSRTMRDRVVAREKEELRRRESAYRGGRPPLDIQGKIVIMVDDGLATGASMRAAVSAVRAKQPSRIVVAVPVAPPETCGSFKALADEVICLMTPRPFSAVGLWYADFSQTSDEEVCRLLEQANNLFQHRRKHSETGEEHDYESRIAG